MFQDLPADLKSMHNFFVFKRLSSLQRLTSGSGIYLLYNIESSLARTHETEKIQTRITKNS